MLRGVEPKPCGADRTRNFAHEDGEQQKQPQRKSARTCRPGHRGVADRQPKKKQEEGMDANIHAEKSADRKRPPTHVSIVCAAGVRLPRATAYHGERCASLPVPTAPVSYPLRAACGPVLPATACAKRSSISLRRGSMAAVSSISMPAPEQLESKR